MKKDLSCGSEINRIKEFGDYDQKEFNELYKIAFSYIKKLSYNIDERRLNISKDLVQSFFMDKFLYIYNKYHKIYEFEQLKANVLSGLKNYSYRLMREGYTQRSEFNQSLVSFEDLLDDSKMDIQDEHSPEYEYLSELLDNFMKDRLTPDEHLIWKVLIDPPLFFFKRIQKSKGKLSIPHLMEFFEFPRNRASYKYFSYALAKIYEVQEEAKIQLKN